MNNETIYDELHKIKDKIDHVMHALGHASDRITDLEKKDIQKTEEVEELTKRVIELTMKIDESVPVITEAMEGLANAFSLASKVARQ